MAPELLTLVLEFYRAPLRFGHLTDLALPLPDAFENWLTETGIALAPGNIRETAVFLGTSPDKLRAAFLFFVRQTLLLPQADHYRVLGLSRQCSIQAIKQHHRLLVRLFHPDRTAEDDERSVAITARINDAYQTLRDPLARRCYDNQLPALLRSGLTTVDERGFFRPRDWVMPLCGGLRPAPERPARARSAWLWMFAVLVLLALLYGTAREPSQPALRINPELAMGNASDPSFLRADQATSVHGKRPEIADIVDGNGAVNDEQPTSVRVVPEFAVELATQAREIDEPEAIHKLSDKKATRASFLTPILAPPNPLEP